MNFKKMLHLRSQITLGCALTFSPLVGFAAEEPAWMLADACKVMLSSGKSPNAMSYLCMFKIEGFLVGYRRGAEKGVSTALISEPAAAATINGFDDLMRKVDRLRPKAACYGDIGVNEVLPLFINYMAVHPEQRDQPYGIPLREALDANYCK